MRLVLDVENTVTERGGKLHLDPFEETNTLGLFAEVFNITEQLNFEFQQVS